MGDVIKATFGKKAQVARVKRSALCQNGHHDWQLETKSRFDVKRGKLVTVYSCRKCGKTKTTAE